MSRPCGPVGFGGGCGGVSTAGITFPSGGCCPPCAPGGGILGIFGELQFAVIPVLSAPCFGGVPFTLVTVPGGTATPLSGPVFAGVTLNPVSSPQFVESSPGVLQYNGPTGKFFVSFDVTVSFQPPPPTTARLLTALICVNGVPVQSSAGTELFQPGEPDVAETLNGQALVQLKAGDMLTICMADLAAGIFLEPVIDNLCLSQLSLIAQSAG